MLKEKIAKVLVDFFEQEGIAINHIDVDWNFFRTLGAEQTTADLVNIDVRGHAPHVENRIAIHKNKRSE